jgi:hypothetical protein
MDVEYCFASPDGDIVLGPDDLRQPFLLAPGRQHPFLTLSDYFSCMERFVCRDNGQLLNRLLHEHLPACLPFNGLKKITITSDKHGALYHIARVTLQTADATGTLAMIAAVEEKSRESLQREFLRLGDLNEKRTPSYLPAVYCQGHEQCSTPAGTATIAFVLGQWLSGFHEWHLAIDPTDRREKIRLWDSGACDRFLADREARKLIRQAAAILTHYYDCRTFEQIRAWHHAAGDFVARCQDGRVEVRLITVRDYGPPTGFPAATGTNMETGLVMFLLNLTLRMRLDRLDGVGAPAWLEEFAVEESVRGFLATIAALEKDQGLPAGFVDQFRSLLTTFDQRDFAEIYQQFLPADGRIDADEADLLKNRLPEHCHQLWQTLAAL